MLPLPLLDMAVMLLLLLLMVMVIQGWASQQGAVGLKLMPSKVAASTHRFGAANPCCTIVFDQKGKLHTE